MDTSTVITNIQNFGKTPFIRVGDKDEFIMRAVSSSNGDIFTLSVKGTIPVFYLSQYSNKIMIKKIELPRLLNPNMAISKNGDIIIVDTTVLLLINANFEISLIFLANVHQIFSEINLYQFSWYVSALTVNNQNEIIMVVANENGLRFFAYCTSDNDMKIYSIDSTDDSKYSSISVNDNILLSSINGIEMYDYNFMFKGILIPQNVNFVRDTFGNIATVDNKELKGYSADGQLLIERNFKVKEIHDMQLYPGNHIMILYSNEPFAVTPKQKIIIV